MLSKQRIKKRKYLTEQSSIQKNLIKRPELPLISRKNSQSSQAHIPSKCSIPLYPKINKTKNIFSKQQERMFLNKFSIINSSSSRPNNQKIDQSVLVSLDISSKNWCLYDCQLSKWVGFRHQYRRQIASLTKIMTTFICVQLIDQLQIPKSMVFRVTSTAACLNGTTAQLVANTYISIQDLLYGSMLPSGNDAAYLLAQYFAQKGSLPNKTVEELDLTSISTTSFVNQFMTRMNQQAYELGLINTRFSNPHGLSNAMNTSSAKDILKLSFKASKHPFFAKIMSTLQHTYKVYEDRLQRKKKQGKWWNTNKLLRKNWRGVKTGQTTTAGSCLSSLKQGIHIVVLNCSNIDSRFSDTEKIFDWYVNQRQKERGRQGRTDREVYRPKRDFSRIHTVPSNYL